MPESPFTGLHSFQVRAISFQECICRSLSFCSPTWSCQLHLQEFQKKEPRVFCCFESYIFPKQKSGNLIWSNYNDLTRPGPLKGSWGREIRRNLGWCILIWPDMMVDFFNSDVRQHYFLFGNSCKQFKYGMTVWYQWYLCTFCLAY